MNLSSKNPPNYNSGVESGDGYYWQQLQMCGKQTTNYSNADFQVFKKPRICEPMKNSASKMALSSPYRSKQARPTNTKPQFCLQFVRGKCNYGDNCIFTHDDTGDARKLPYNYMGGIVAENQHRMLSRGKFCWFFINGKACPYGNRCHFLHRSIKPVVKGGFRVARENAAVTVVNIRAGEGYMKGYDELESKRFENMKSDAGQMQQKTVHWKTRLCHKWEKNGHCPYGVKCQYAHGESELCKLGSFAALASGKFFAVENLAVVTEDATSSKRENRATHKQQEKNNKCLIKWDNIEKISRIYADWIDNMPPIHVTVDKYDAEKA